jgi:hypothetical protein
MSSLLVSICQLTYLVGAARRQSRWATSRRWINPAYPISSGTLLPRGRLWFIIQNILIGMFLINHGNSATW